MAADVQPCSPSAGDTSASANASASDSDVSAAQLSIAVQFMSGKVLGVDVVPEITIGELKETLKAGDKGGGVHGKRCVFKS